MQNYYDQIYGRPIPQPAFRNPNSILPWVIIAIIAIAYAHQSGWIHIGPIDNNSDVVVIDPVDPDDDSKPTPVDINGSYIVRVYETETDACPTWLVKLLDSDSFWFDWLPDHGMNFYTFDPDNKQSESFIAAASAAGISPPFWLHAKSGNVLSVQPFLSSDSIGTIKQAIQRQ